MQFELPLIFHSDGVPLVGRFIRNNDRLSERQPAVIVTGSWLTVKEQMPTVYARALAERGFTAFIFDFSGFGESKGEPRQTEIPARKIADIVAAAEFVGSMSFIAPDRIGHLAICASAQYALAALARGARTRALASVAGWFHDAASVAPFYGGTAGVTARLARACAAADRYVATGELSLVPAFDPGNERAGMFLPLDYYAKVERGAVSAWKNAMNEMTWLYWLTFDGLSAAAEVEKPVLLVHSDECVLPDNVRTVHARLKGQKEIVWSTGGQIDFYDRPDLVESATRDAASWFERVLPD